MSRATAMNVKEQYDVISRIESPYAAIIRDYVLTWGDDLVLPNVMLTLKEYAAQLVKDDHEEAMELALAMYNWQLAGAATAANVISEEYNDYMADAYAGAFRY